MELPSKHSLGPSLHGWTERLGTLDTLLLINDKISTTQTLIITVWSLWIIYFTENSDNKRIPKCHQEIYNIRPTLLAVSIHNVIIQGFNINIVKKTTQKTSF